MLISELFYSVQGEGSLIGVPSVFIRTSGCNLRCVWCDTPYTSWAPEGNQMSVDELVSYVRAHSTGFTVLTGGEPMIAPETPALTRALRAEGEHITIETAGTSAPEVECDLMSISPKLANSTPWERDGGRWAAQHERTRWNAAAVRSLMRYEYQLKFVISAPSDIEEAAAMAEEAGAPPRKVILMPEGVDAEAQRERSTWIAEACKQRGFRFSPRLHVALYGNRRGT